MMYAALLNSIVCGVGETMNGSCENFDSNDLWIAEIMPCSDGLAQHFRDENIAPYVNRDGTLYLPWEE